MKKSILMSLLIVSAVVLAGCDEMFLDIKPQSCPNPLNVKSNGVLPVAILGTDNLDVGDVNVASIILLSSVDPIIEVKPIAGKVDYNDVSYPIERGDAPDCNCAETSSDGYMDLVIYFDKQDVVTAIEEALGAPLEDGLDVPLLLVAELWENTDPDNYDLLGYDCIVIRNKGRGRNE
jgi:hypothetical protein